MTMKEGLRGLDQGNICEAPGALSSELQARLKTIRGIHLAGEIRKQGLGTRANPWFSEFIIAPTAHTDDPSRWDNVIDRVGKTLAPFEPEVQHTIIHIDGMLEFPSLGIWRKDAVRDERLGIYVVPTERFGLSIVRYFNKKSGEFDPEFELRTCMVTPDELSIIMQNHSLHSPDYRDHNKGHK